MQFVVMPIKPETAMQATAERWVLNRRDLVKDFFTSKRDAERVAQDLAKKSPGVQYGVFAVVDIYETLPPPPPKVVHKGINEAGEIVVVT